MKSMAQIQNEMLKQARFDGGYPRHVIFPPGILALANNEDEFNKFRRQSYIASIVLFGGLTAIFVCLLCFVIFAIWFK